MAIWSIIIMLSLRQTIYRGEGGKDTWFGTLVDWRGDGNCYYPLKTVWAPAHDACDGCDDNTGAAYVYNENE